MALDLTLDPVQVAFVLAGVNPTTPDWVTATWVRTGVPTSKITTMNGLTLEYRYIPVSGTTSAGTDTANVRVLVGPGGDLQLPAAGSKVDVWVKLTDNPEAPVVKAGTITVV